MLRWLAEPGGWNADFRAYTTPLTARTARMLVALIAASGVALWPLDAFLESEGDRLYVAGARIVVATMGALGWATLRWSPPAVARQPGWTTSAFLAGGVLGSSWWLAHAGGLDRPWFYLAYATIPLTVVLQVGLPQRVLTNLGLVVAHVAGFVAARPDTLSDPDLSPALFFMVFEALAGCVVGHQMLHLTRRAWTEQERAAALLANILPVPIAARLQAGEQPVADAIPDATVLFADLEGFTSFADSATAVELVTLLNEVFTTFDQLTARHGVEKIKTIGDAYMVAAGVSAPRADHCEAICALALEMLTAVGRFRYADRPLTMRVGIHSGPVIAGVIGLHKFAFDLWGDTVNQASRMESLGEGGRVQVTQAVHDRLGPGWRLEERGTIGGEGQGRDADLVAGRTGRLSSPHPPVAYAPPTSGTNA